MAKAGKFKEANFCWKGDPKANVVDLEVLKTSVGSYSVWNLSDEDIAELVKTKKLWLCVGATTFHPPVGVSAIEPAEVVMAREMEKQPIDIKLRLDKAS